jgi:hypothetical protein
MTIWILKYKCRVCGMDSHLMQGSCEHDNERLDSSKPVNLINKYTATKLSKIILPMEFRVLQIIMIYRIWGFHGGDYEECCLLGYYTMWPYGATFKKTAFLIMIYFSFTNNLRDSSWGLFYPLYIYIYIYIYVCVKDIIPHHEQGIYHIVPFILN